MTEILPGRHLRLVEQIAAGPHHALEKLRDADLPLIRVLVGLNIQRHLLGHVFDDLRGDHHVAAVQAAAVIRHLRELPADAENHVAVCHAVLQGGQPDGSALAQVWTVAVPESGFPASQTSPSGQPVGTAGAALHGHLAGPSRVPGQIPGYHRRTHLPAIIVPLAVRTGLRIQCAGYCNNDYGSVRLIILSDRLS